MQVKKNILAKKNITRGDVVFLSYKALNTALKGTGKTLLIKLVDSGAIDKDKAINTGMYVKYGIYEDEINLVDNYAYGNYANGRYALKYQNDTYYTKDYYIIKKSADGSEKKITDKEVSNLFIDDGYIYYSAYSQYNGEIFRQNLATGEEQKLTNETGLEPFVAGDWVYYRSNNGDWITGYIYKMKKDGSENQKVSDVLIREFLVFDNRIFYVDEQWKLYSMNTDGTDVKVHSESHVRNIFVADQWLFYISGSKDIKAVKIVKGEFTETRLIMGSIKAISANLYNGWVYYVDDSDQYMLKKVKLDGSELVSIKSATNIEHINIVDGYVYYSKRNSRESYAPHYRIKLDGTEDTRIDAPKPKVR